VRRSGCGGCTRTEQRWLEAARIVAAGAWTTSLLPELPLPLQSAQVLLGAAVEQNCFRRGFGLHDQPDGIPTRP
jgi:hypothetical protein